MRGEKPGQVGADLAPPGKPLGTPENEQVPPTEGNPSVRDVRQAHLDRAAEPEIYKAWIKAGCFNAHANDSSRVGGQRELDLVDRGYITEKVRLEHESLAEAALQEVTGLMEYLQSPEALRNARRARERRIASRDERRAEPRTKKREPRTEPEPEHEPRTGNEEV